MANVSQVSADESHPKDIQLVIDALKERERRVKFQVHRSVKIPLAR